MTEYSNNGQPARAQPQPPEFGEGGVSLLGLLNILLRRRYLVVGLPILAFLAAFLLTERKEGYIARSKLLVSGGGQVSSGLGNLARQLGLEVGGGVTMGPGTPQFLGWVIRSKDVLKRAAEHEYSARRPEGDTIRGHLGEVYYGLGVTSSPDINVATDVLSLGLSSGLDKETGFFEILTEAPTPELAVQLNRAVLQELEEYSVAAKKAEAAKEREFYEERMEVAMHELLATEDSVEGFFDRNRQFYPRGSAGRANDPAMDFEFARLQARLEVRRNVLNGLVSAYEQSRITEARATSDITIVEQPENSVTPAASVGRTPKANGMIALLSALIFTIGLAFLLEYLRGQPARNPEDYDELRQLTRQAIGDLRPDRLIQRVPRFRVRRAELEKALAAEDGQDGERDS